MYKVKKIILLVAALFLFSLSVYAETKDVSYKLTVDGEDIEVAEDSLKADKDYSDLYVNVIKDTKGEQTTIYSGVLGGYANGEYSDIDFSEINIMVIVDYNTMGEEAIYIIPAAEQEILSTTAVEAAEDSEPAGETAEVQSTSMVSASNIQTDISLVYNNEYHENVILPGQTLSVPVTVANTGSETAEIISYIAEYDLTGRLTNLTQGAIITATASQTVTAEVTKTFSADAACTAKIFLWQKSNMMPVCESVVMTVYNQDYYKDTYAQAQKINIDKTLCGIINTGEDIDIVKFTPNTTGLYALQLAANGTTVCGLYDSQQNLLNSAGAVEGSSYLLYSLTAGQNYYIRFSGSENNSYEITPALPGDLVTITKNIGAAGNTADSYDVYKFVPQSTGTYIITAVDSTNVKAELYNASFEKTASSAVGDDVVSFRITSGMTANQEYYVVVAPKSETGDRTYTLYVEEPFALISVE